MKGGHVRVDVLYGRLSPRNRCVVDLTGHLFLLLPVCIFIFWTSLPYVRASWRILEGSADVGGIPAVFLLKTLIPVLAVLLFLQGLCEITRSARGLRRDA
jgi:TRAP-type mannitol/chloroaromatic compound transport system permease small subunit